MSLLEDLSFELHLAFWGAYYSGHIEEMNAVLAEGRGRTPSRFYWDSTRRSLDTQLFDSGDGYERVPDRFALHYVLDRTR